MPRDGSGIYTTPAGTTAVPDTTIESSKYNGNIADVAADLNAARPIVAGGTGGNSAATARTNLKAEVSGQVVTNYDSHTWENGSFYSAPGATGAPNAPGWFTGICTMIDSGMLSLHAQDMTSFITYNRTKVGGAGQPWSAWVPTGASSFVELAGDTMTGNLTLVGTTPAVYLNGASTPLIVGQLSGSTRWVMALGWGGNDFRLINYNDAGVEIGSALSINRTTGNVAFANNWQIGGADISNGGIIATSGLVALRAPGNGTIYFQNGGAGGSTINYGSFSTTGLSTINVAATGQVSANSGGFSPSAPGSASLKGSGAFGGGLTLVDGASYGTMWMQATSLMIGTGSGTIGSDPIILDSNRKVTLGTGFTGRAGFSGANSGFVHNLNWTGTGCDLWVDVTNQGKITTTSDYRIKKDVADLPSTWDAVKALRPISYTQAEYTPAIEKQRKLGEAIAAREAGYDVPAAKPGYELEPMYVADDIVRFGFIAHEVQAALIDSAAEGVKDQPNCVQSLNLAPIVASLTKALQEAMARIEALEAAASVPVR